MQKGKQNQLIKFLKLSSCDRVRGLHAAVTVSNVDVKKSLRSKRIKVPGNQSKCEILFDVSLLTAENRRLSLLPAALPSDVYWPRRLTVEGLVLKHQDKV